MDKNRVVTFGSLGGQSTPSSLSNVVNTGGYIFKGYYPSAAGSNWLKYVYYGYAAGDADGNFYIPVFNTDETTYFYQSNISGGSFSTRILFEAIASFAGNPRFVQYSTIVGLSEDSPKMDIFTLFKKDENGEFVEALDENGDPIYYAEEHIDDLNS